MKTEQTYTSPLRAEQMEQTRLRILRATTDLLADPTSDELTVPLVAREARVSLRTVYRYFPTREALLDAWAEWMEESSQAHLLSYPEHAGRLAAFARELYRSFDANEALFKALLNSKAARAARE